MKSRSGGSRRVVLLAPVQPLLAGRYTGGSGTTEMANLTFEDNTVKFSVTVGNGMIIDFSAIVAEDKLAGELSMQYGGAGITGTRRK